MNPTNTVFDAKRLIGRNFDDPAVQSDMKHWPFNVVSIGGKPKIEVIFPPYLESKILFQMFKIFS